MEIITFEEQTDHPLESILGIEASTTMVEYQEIERKPPVEMVNYDAKDREIEDKLEDIYTAAMSQAVAIGDEMDRVEGRHKARVGEVSATMLNVALSVVREKSALKMHKDKLTSMPGGMSVGAGGTVNNNIIVADRNEIMRMMLAQATGALPPE